MNVLANIGLPTVALYLPPAWLALLPIILIEASYGARHYQLPFRRAFLAQATANCWRERSTFRMVPGKRRRRASDVNC